MSGYSAAKAFCNLVGRGWPPDEALRCAHDWVAEQLQFGWTHLTQRDADADVELESPLETGRLYLTARYGCYPQLFKMLAQRSTDRTVYCLAGNTSEEMRRITERLTSLANCRVEFIAVSPSTIRSLRQKLAEGHSAVMLFDVPFRSTSGSREIPIPTALGEYRATSAIVRLPGLLDPQWRGVYCERNDGRDTVRALQGRELPALVREFAAIVERRPSHYEQLPDLDKHWSAVSKADIAAIFEHKGETLLLQSREMRIWKVPVRIGREAAASAAGNKEMCRLLSERLGVRIDGIFPI